MRGDNSEFRRSSQHLISHTLLVHRFQNLLVPILPLNELYDKIGQERPLSDANLAEAGHLHVCRFSIMGPRLKLLHTRRSPVSRYIARDSDEVYVMKHIADRF